MRPLRSDMKKEGIVHSEEWSYYLSKLKDNLHLCMCFSPAGDQLRNRCRNFPGLIANSTIDWFFEWPEEALVDVANYKLNDFNLDDEMKPDIIKFFAKLHISVND
jgi:dynein heavy chain